jgi:hypothetical protein
MDVSIIYVNYKTPQLIIDSIDTLKSHTADLSYEIIVVDNHSEDCSEASIKTAFPEVQYIASPANIGFGRANNLAKEVVRGKYILFLNPDTLLLSNTILEMFTFLETNKLAGACGGNLVNENLVATNSFGRFYPSLFEEFLNTFYLKRFTWRATSSQSYNHTAAPLEVASIVGADLMTPRNVLDRVGWFDPDFFMNFEETELCFRIHKAGYTIMSIPSARIIHLEGKSSYVSASRLERFFHGQYVFFYKRYGMKGAKRLNQIIHLKCSIRLFCFRILQSKTKQAYWYAKREANKQVYTQFIKEKA